MEKKTIGKFISALRKANGMTQKELGEKLFVSDKTVSRWECDECTPELSLIPSIAEIFGITTDELLRGERNNPDREAAHSEETICRQKAKSDKQFKLMLDTKSRKYKYLTVISIGITFLGFIAAMIANLAFSKGLIAFCLVIGFCVVSEICQICFAINLRIMLDEDDNTYTDRIEAVNTKVVRTAVAVSFVNIILLAFCLPLVTLIDGTNFGLRFEYWLGYGLLFSVIALAGCYVIYTLFVRKALCECNLIVLAEKQKSEMIKNNKLLVKIISIAATIAIALGACIFVWNIIGWDIGMKELTFDNCADFKAFMERDYDKWFKEGYSYVDENGDVIVEIPISPDNVISVPNEDKVEDDYYPQKIYEKIYNSEGEVICEYYCNPDLYKSIVFTETSDDKMPVTVITKEAYYDAHDTVQTVESILYTLIVIDFIVAAGIYLLKVFKATPHNSQ